MVKITDLPYDYQHNILATTDLTLEAYPIGQKVSNQNGVSINSSTSSLSTSSLSTDNVYMQLIQYLLLQK